MNYELCSIKQNIRHDTVTCIFKILILNIQDSILNIQDKKYLQPCPLRGSVSLVYSRRICILQDFAAR